MTDERIAPTRDGCPEPRTLTRSLTSRHVQFIALGGAIGAGFFFGTGKAISDAGPGVLLAYAMAGLVVYVMARALGELSLNRPIQPSFTGHVDDFVGAWAGFMTGWSYWLMYVLVGIIELTAIGLCVRFWLPVVPQWLPALLALVGLYLLNRLPVRLFGETEFYLAIIKVVAIVALLVAGAVIILLHLGPSGHAADIRNLWRFGGFFPAGIEGFLVALPIALFVFGGTEILGLTVAESEDPSTSLPRAINSVVLRITVFYIGSVIVIAALTPWNALNTDTSPFVFILNRIGLPSAASLLNFVVLTALISSCNSGIFGTGRILLSLAERNQAPAPLARLDHRRLPANAISASALIMLCGVGLNYVAPARVLGLAMSVTAGLQLWVWLMIIVSHLRAHRVIARGGMPIRFPAPLYPVANWAAIVFIAAATVIMTINEVTRPTTITTLVWFAVLALVYATIPGLRRRLDTFPTEPYALQSAGRAADTRERDTCPASRLDSPPLPHPPAHDTASSTKQQGPQHRF